MLSVHEAVAAIGARLPRFPAESCALGEAAGRILREDVHAERDQPPFDRVMMDGIAIASKAYDGGQREFRVQASQAAGDPPLTLEHERNCIEIMTGAVLPEGCDSIVPVEDIELRDGSAQLGPGATVQAHRYVHRRGSDHAAGARLLQAGQVLHAPELAVLAAAGKPEVRLARRPAVAIVATGDELVDAGLPIEPHQIRRSNDRALAGALRERGFTEVARAHLPDEPQHLESALGELLRGHEVLVLSGGVSRGKHDYVPEVLERLGVQRHFHRVAQYPGRPMWFGTAAGDRLVFALPGNPVSTFACFYRYVLPALHDAMGGSAVERERVRLAAPVEYGRPLTYFLPVTLGYSEDGTAWATPRPFNTSGDFAGLAGTHGFVELEPEPEHFPRGHACPLYRW